MSQRLTALGVIPARLASTRLPRKVLREIAGKPLIVHVWEAAKRSPELADVLVATDAPEVVAACARFAVPAVLTSAEHPSGTDRVWEIAQSRAADVYVNIQGDEPLVTSGHLQLLVAPFQRRPETQVSTLCIRATAEELPKPSVNKVVRDAEGRALYFSKYPIPYDRDGIHPVRYKHVGLY
ncbi:MAG: 3-deoxy-manno-octulosonate cytidylyltransferase, partial [Candidatus Rokuibacteriota bacterium]